ncbi:conserved hypothetical protein [Frankia canadensis]|uniref:Mycothiol-dependent maleylpyruvate isomerase metal-binding domain-containing protein n=1 Tax=Frankia canadensis TaxID=1836972 RepID=A0A2I2KQ40_9ACTN|nr:maleylpyruvate isomerase family mycothiol-dependent enzyme [Frankia canadensis]SNQ47788.1 conserved hypothetical protein [Frankia canadensis]SOU55078.1 conserved hypothetical protein [Frankia canadensis]
MADDYESMLLAALASTIPAPGGADVPSLGDGSGMGGQSAPPGPPPVGALLAAARASRPPVPEVPAFAASFRAAAGMLDAVLAGVDPARLTRPSPVLDWSLGDLVTHLAAGYAQLTCALGAPTELPVAAEADLESATRAVLAWTAAERTLPERRALWWDAVTTLAAALRAPSAFPDRVLQVAGHTMPVAGHVVTRAFETWIHARDIALGTGMRLPDPAGEVIGPMADLAARTLAGLAARSPTRGQAGTVALALTGPGGGSWLVRLGAPAPSGGIEAAGDGVDAELTVDTVAFCLLVSDRIARPDLDVVVDGDVALAEDLLALAPALSGP